MDWEDVRFFLALARHGSLSAAARQLHVNHATVARRIGALEAALGQVLFERRVDGYGLTRNGEAALEAAAAMEASALELSDAVRHDAPQGTVRITAVPSVAKLVAAGLGGFQAAHPKIAIELITEIRIASLARREADLALRLGRPQDSRLIGRKLTEIHYAFYAAAAVAKTIGKGAAAPLIGYDADAEEVLEARWLARTFPGRPVGFRSNSNDVQAAAARAGLGMVLLPRYMGDTDQGLREVIGIEPHPPRELWLLSPRELARTPRVRAVMDALVAIFAKPRRA